MMARYGALTSAHDETIRDRMVERNELISAPGCDPKLLERARRLFLRQHSRGLFPGGQLVAHVAGEPVLDVSVGIARGFREAEHEAPREVTPETPFHVFSAGKPLVAFALATLEARGQLSVTSRVAEYFPEFAANGKHDITLLDILTHHSGLTMRDFTRAGPKEWSDWRRVITAIVDARPEYPRGTFAYQPFSFGWVLAEVVHRVTGMMLPEFLRTVLPLRVVEDLRWGVPPSALPELARAYCLSKRLVVDHIDIAKDFEAVNNSPEFMSAFVPGAGVITTARGLAAFYDIIAARGRDEQGRALLPENLLSSYVRRARAGRERSLGLYMAIGRGFAPGGRAPSLYGFGNSTGCAGHAGNFSTLGFADTTRRLSVAIVTNGNRSLFDLLWRFAPISGAIRRAVPQVSPAL